MTDEGSLIALEGLDGSGKSVVRERIAEWAADSDFDVLTTEEPSDTEAGRQVRERLGSGLPTPMSDLRLFCEDREQHLDDVIEPALAERDAVVVDRYVDSTRAYQAAALAADAPEGTDLDDAADRVEGVIDEYDPREPDLTIYLKCPVETALERTDATESYEQRDLLERVRERYEQLYGRCDPSVRIVDATRPLAVVAHMAVNAVQTELTTPTDGVARDGKSYADAIDEG